MSANSIVFPGNSLLGDGHTRPRDRIKNHFYGGKSFLVSQLLNMKTHKSKCQVIFQHLIPCMHFPLLEFDCSLGQVLQSQQQSVRREIQILFGGPVGHVDDGPPCIVSAVGSSGGTNLFLLPLRAPELLGLDVGHAGHGVPQREGHVARGDHVHRDGDHVRRQHDEHVVPAEEDEKENASYSSSLCLNTV